MSTLLRVLAGLIGWAAGFSLLYGLHGIGCARGWSSVSIGPLDLQRLVLGVAWLGSVVAVAAWTRLVWRAPHGTVPLLDRLAYGSAITGLFAMIISGVPIVITDPCRVETPQPPLGTVAARSGFERIPCQAAALGAAAAHEEAVPVYLHANNTGYA